MLAIEREIRNCDPAPIVEVRPGFSPAIDEAAARAAPSHAFLRRAWFEPAATAGTATIIGRRGDGSMLAAIPLAPMGPVMLGARMVPGSYWPFRTPPVAADATLSELKSLFGNPAADGALGQVWRMGPFHAGDPSAEALKRAAQSHGWTVLERPLGTSFVMDIPALASQGEWPKPSTMRKVRALERQLAAAEGPLSLRFVKGAGWDAAAIEALAAIEANSWVGTRTDGSGAKFLRPEQRLYWEGVLRDTTLADMLSAAILFVGETPAAFSFDLNVGRLQYGIAGSYDDRFARWSAGKIVTWRHLEESAARGIEIVDWGSGDNGYKSRIGAVAGPEIVDCLFVRSRSLASILRPRWIKAASGGEDADAPALLTRRQQLVVAAIVTAAAAASFAE